MFTAYSYEESDWGWHESRKKSELKDEDARFFLAFDEEHRLVAFSHFRFELDGNTPVIYW